MNTEWNSLRSDNQHKRNMTLNSEEKLYLDQLEKNLRKTWQSFSNLNLYREDEIVGMFNGKPALVNLTINKEKQQTLRHMWIGEAMEFRREVSKKQQFDWLRNNTKKIVESLSNRTKMKKAAKWPFRSSKIMIMEADKEEQTIKLKSSSTQQPTLTETYNNEL